MASDTGAAETTAQPTAVQRPRVTQPQNAAVVRCDSHLPAIAPEALQPAALQRRLSAPPAWSPEHPGDGGLFAGRQPRAASVLIALIERENGLHVLLTRRTDHLHDHAGQISFPGGRQDDADADVIDTALREAEEEVGLARAQVRVIGQLPIYTTVTNYRVTPVVALVQSPVAWVLDSFEVAEAFEVPLAFLMNPAHHQRRRFEFDGGEHFFLSMPWQSGGREYFIWGATAAMLRNFYGLLAAD